MGKLINMPKKLEPFAFWVVPAKNGGVSKYVLTATPWNSDDASRARGYITMADLLEELACLGADQTVRGSVRRSLEAGCACTIPRLWLTPPQVDLFMESAVKIESPSLRTGMQDPAWGTSSREQRPYLIR